MSSAMTDVPKTWPIIWKAALVASILFVIGMFVLIPRATLQLLFPDQTVYASGFSEAKFAQVRAGMESEEVLVLLGPPLAVVVEPPNRQTYKTSWRDRPVATGIGRWWWEYSEPGRFYDSYHMRSIEMDMDGKVVHITRHYYQD